MLSRRGFVPFLWFGNLNNRSHAGLRYANLNNRVDRTRWNILRRISDKFESCFCILQRRATDLREYRATAGDTLKIDRDGIGLCRIKDTDRRHGGGHARGLVVKPKALEIRKDCYETL